MRWRCARADPAGSWPVAVVFIAVRMGMLFGYSSQSNRRGSRIDVMTIRELEKVRSPFRTARWKACKRARSRNLSTFQKAAFEPQGSITTAYVRRFQGHGDTNFGFAVRSVTLESNMIRTIAFVAATAAMAANAGATDRTGRNAYGAVPPGSAPLAAPQSAKRTSNDRETAIRECNQARSGYSQTGWGVRSDQIYRSCMASRGQPE
jgi:hypothetical protein